jgi:predicted TIM-barrel fold metal-dependent hydrolase
MTSIRRPHAGISLAFALIALSAELQAQESGRYQGPIIDMHVHASSERPVLPDGQPVPLPCFPDFCDIRPQGGNSNEDLRIGHLAMMERYHIVLGMLSDYDIRNALRWAEAAPGRYRVGVSGCDAEQFDLNAIERLFESRRLDFIGEVTSQYCGIAADDPSLDVLMAFAAEHDLIVQFHSHGGYNRGSVERQGNRARIEAGRPTHIEELLYRYPGLRVYFEDAGFPLLYDTVALMRQHPDVYADLANITWMISRDVFQHYLEELMRYGLGKQLMFSTDANIHWEGIGRAIEAIETAEFLSAQEKADIFYNNAARFLKLSEEEIASHHAR